MCGMGLRYQYWFCYFIVSCIISCELPYSMPYTMYDHSWLPYAVQTEKEYGTFFNSITQRLDSNLLILTLIR